MLVGALMFIHVVYFWLKDNLSAAEKDAFTHGVKSLTTIKSVRQAYTGVPATTDRPVIDRTYSYALVAVFANQRDHDLYQSDPIHDRFRTECGAFWKKVVIYDSVA
jgi:Stress responsive A/B Barrel Domain